MRVALVFAFDQSGDKVLLDIIDWVQQNIQAHLYSGFFFNVSNCVVVCAEVKIRLLHPLQIGDEEIMHGLLCQLPFPGQKVLVHVKG